MACEYCLGEFDHDTKCPNYEQSKPTHYCSICGQGIYDGEEYLKNDNGEFRHYDCFFSLRELLQWLGYEIKTMENDYD